MDYIRLGKYTFNAVRVGEMLQILVRHGFADMLRRTRLHVHLPARLIRHLPLGKIQEHPAETFGARLRAALSELGPTYVKFGQILSTRPDLVGIEIAHELALLQDQVPPRPFEEMVRVLEKELKAPVNEIFTEFDQEPVASASMSQVYRARLPGGTDVAVKVQRPGILAIIESDLRLMYQAADWIAGRFEFVQWIDPPGIVREFERTIRRELDFGIEAGIIDRFETALESQPDVEVPYVHHGYSTGRVLTMDWVDGVRVDCFEEYDARNCDRETIAKLSVQTLCELIFEHRVFHADPHPGNVFILRDNRLALLDLGMAGHLEEGDVAALADLLLAVFHEDAVECGQAVLNLTTEGLAENRLALEHELADFIAFEGKSILAGGNVAQGLERTIEIIRHQGLELAPRFAMLIKALATLESLGHTLSPGMDFSSILQPYLERMAMRRYGPAQLLRNVRRDARLLARIGAQAPEDAMLVLQQLRRGRLQIRLHLPQLEELPAILDRSGNRQAVSVIAAAMMIGSSLIVASGGPVGYFAVAGLVVSGVLGAAIVLSAIWTRKH